MKDSLIEIAEITLADGKTEADLIAASDMFQTEFLQGQPGFIKRNLIRRDDGTYADIVHWKSKPHAETVMAKAETAPACHAYFSVMKMDNADPASGLAFYTNLASYSAS